MQNTTTFRIFLTAGLAFFIISCNSSSKKDKDNKEKDTAITDASLVPLPANPGQAITETKCFSNDGLKYSVTITLNYSSAMEVAGNVVSKDLESGESEVAKFTGVIAGEQLTVGFSGNKPVIGAASEWTTKPWAMGAKKISIPFNAKDHDSNKWKETNYEFELSACK